MNHSDRAAISRANGAQSRGPVTPAGKARSSRNAVTHGLTSRDLALPASEDAALFNALFEELLREHNPQTLTERAMVESMFASIWRRYRVWNLETTTLACQTEERHKAAPADPSVETMYALRYLAANTRILDILSRFEGQYDRQFFRALSKLKWLQQQRPHAPVAAPPLTPEALPEPAPETTPAPGE